MKSPKKSYRIIKTSRPLVLSLSCTKPSFNKSSELEFKTTDSSIIKNKKRKVCTVQDDQKISTNQVLNNKPSSSLIASSSTRPNLNSVILQCHICKEEFYGFLYLELHLTHWHEGENIEVSTSHSSLRNSLGEKQKHDSIGLQNRNSSTKIIHPDEKKNSPVLVAPHDQKESQIINTPNQKNIETNLSNKIVTSTNTKIESPSTTDFENQCSYCIKKFVTYQDLEIHLKSHTNKQNRQDICSSLSSKLKSENLSPSILGESSATIIKVNQMMISPSKPTKMSSTQFAFFHKKRRNVS